LKPEFDDFSERYEDLLKDPVRDRFQGGAGDFFHVRKRDLIRSYFRRQRINTRELTYLDLGCGKGELAVLLRDDFERTCGCDPSAAMMKAGNLAALGLETRVQGDPDRIPYADNSFDFVSAVCVYHHVPMESRDRLTAEVARVLKPDGTFAIIEHNPYNPVTRAIVKRTPVDADAILLKPGETKRLLARRAFEISELEFFLYLPEKLYGRIGLLEALLRMLPLGGQYAAFGKRTAG
jgi:ubiquinone/menaquinone biosynthesis C-methylase UbiE